MLVDSFNRQVRYLRISVTQRCNFRCTYCMPDTPFSWRPKENLLTFEELFMFVKVCIDEGINKIRITGGEPLLRKDLDIFIKMISEYKEDIDLALTTNAYFLSSVALKLKQAGLKRINVSLDSLKKETIMKISQKDVLDKILKGIDKAIEVGLRVKLNSVPLKGINDNEIISLLEFSKSKNIMMRFIEFMENKNARLKLQGLNKDEILQIISQKYTFKSIGKQNSSPASLYELENGYIFGIIDPHNHDFCDTCDRIRLTAEGLLIPCLYFDEALSIKEALRQKNIQKSLDILKQVLKNKPEKNRWSNDDDQEISNRAFYQTGG